MKQRKITSAMKKVIAGSLTAMMMLSMGVSAFAGKTLAENINFQEQVKLDDVLYNNNYYGDYLNKNKDAFSDVSEGTSIKIDVNNYTSFEGNEPEIKALEGKENVLYVDDKNKSVSWDVTVEQAGFYQMQLLYLPVDGNSLAVSRGLKIDGEYLYDELSSLKFVRHWVDSADPKKNSL